MDSVNNSLPPKQEDLGETKSSLSAELFCDQVLGEPSVVSSKGEDCSSPVLVAEENGGGNGTFSPGEKDFGLEFVGIPRDLLLGMADFGENEPGRDSGVLTVDVADFGEELVAEQNPDNGGGPRVEEVPAVEECARIVQMQEEEGRADLEWNKVDSPGKIDESNDGISLIVDFFSPPNGTSENKDGKSPCQINDQMTVPFQGEESEGSGQISQNNVPKLDVKENRPSGDNVGNKGSVFLVGAVVWAKTKKSQLWWPGVICDPVDSYRKDSYLVQHLASSNVVWHPSSHLMHFLEGFDQFCHQQDSRSFHAAVERAILEIGERVKTQMTCPCFVRGGEKSSSQLADGTVQRYSWSADRLGVSWGSSEVQFHPAGFLAMIKYLAQNTPATDKINLISTRSCLTAIYRSLGHQQLPVQQFAPDAVKHLPRAGSKLPKKDEAKDELLASSGSPDPADNDLSGGESSRRRRKSKYLSYPFIDPKKGLEKDSGEKVSDPEPQVDKSKSSEGSKNKKLKKSVSGKSGLLNLSGKFKDISSSSSNILSDLHCQALYCLPPKRRSYADSVCRFLCGFRAYRFLKPEIAKEHVYNHDEDGTPISPTAVQERSNETSGVAVTQSNGTPKKITPADGTPKKSRKRKGDKSSSSTTLPSGNALEVAESHEAGEKVSKKRKKAKADSGLHVLSPLPPPPGFGLPDLNGNVPAPAPASASADVNQALGSTVLGLPSTYAQTAEGLPNPGRSNSFRFVQLLKDVQTMGPNFLQYMSQTSHIKAEPQTTAQAAPTMFSFHPMASQQANGSNWQAGSATNNMQPLSPGSTAEKKKRKRKPKTLDSQSTAVPSPIPDLNGKAADCVPPGGHAPGVLSSASPTLNGKAADCAPPGGNAPGVHSSASPTNGKAADCVPPGGNASGVLSSASPTLNGKAAEGNAAGVLSSASRKDKLPIKRRNMAAPVNAPPASLLPHPLMSPPGSAPSLPPPLPLIPIPSIPASAGPGEQSNLLAMQQNLKMMTSMLEKAGSNLSLEKRTVLETEINGLMKKISTMVGSSSSSA